MADALTTLVLESQKEFKDADQKGKMKLHLEVARLAVKEYLGKTSYKVKPIVLAYNFVYLGVKAQVVVQDCAQCVTRWLRELSNHADSLEASIDFLEGRQKVAELTPVFQSLPPGAVINALIVVDNVVEIHSSAVIQDFGLTVKIRSRVNKVEHTVPRERLYGDMEIAIINAQILEGKIAQANAELEKHKADFKNEPPANPETALVLSLSMQPTYTVGEKEISLGELTADALKVSGLDVSTWNKLTDTEITAHTTKHLEWLPNQLPLPEIAKDILKVGDFSTGDFITDGEDNAVIVSFPTQHQVVIQVTDQAPTQISYKVLKSNWSKLPE